tara:strand:+ start:160511 stop:160645 length:135 start_codon:yes stop_codon:yes gene_type:complete
MTNGEHTESPERVRVHTIKNRVIPVGASCLFWLLGGFECCFSAV